MLHTILFDLDGTLLSMNQEEFIRTYFYELTAKLSGMGCDSQMLIKAIWAGTHAMVENDGRVTNREAFYKVFGDKTQLDPIVYEPIFDRFYQEEFNSIKRILGPYYGQKELLKQLREKNYRIVLATAPIFPSVAVETRLSWIGLTMEDFDYVTTYENSHYSKPNTAYYQEIFEKINCIPGDCLMIGNNAVEDMCIGELGADTFLLTNYLENADSVDISVFRNGGIDDLKVLLAELPPYEYKNK